MDLVFRIINNNIILSKWITVIWENGDLTGSLPFIQNVQCEQQPVEEEEEEEEEEVVQQEVEAVIVEGGEEVEEDVEEEEEGVVLQEEGCPAVIVEEVPSAQVEECYSAQVLVYDDETFLMQDVAEEQEVVTEVAETGKAELSLFNLTNRSRRVAL